LAPSEFSVLASSFLRPRLLLLSSLVKLTI
jgi:hypothetical protein